MTRARQFPRRERRLLIRLELERRPAPSGRNFPPGKADAARLSFDRGTLLIQGVDPNASAKVMCFVDNHGPDERAKTGFMMHRALERAHGARLDAVLALAKPGEAWAGHATPWRRNRSRCPADTCEPNP